MITSRNNELVKYYTKLMTSKKKRDEDGVFIVEGEHLVQEAIKSNLVEEIIISDRKYDFYQGKYVSTDIMKKICDTKNPQGIIALCKQNYLEPKKYERLLLIDNIQDPGNLGTIIRSCVAFNFDGIILNLQTVDVYNPKVVRATQGAIFRVPILREDLRSYIDKLKKEDVIVYGTSFDGENLENIGSAEKMAFILGNEGNGVSRELLDITDNNIYIEISECTESLNVSVAGSIIMYKFRK